jgi:hypothetical protein
MFGFYGWGTSGDRDHLFSRNEYTVLFFLLVAILSIYACRGLINSILSNGPILKLKHFSAFLIIFLVFILFSIQKLGRDLTGDELSYSLNSVEHSLGILNRIFEKLPLYIQNLSASRSIQITSLLIFLSMILFVKITFRIKKDLHFTLLIYIATVFTRTGISIAGGKDYPNSPLPSFASFITTSLFGVDGVVYRLTTLFIFATVATYILFCFSGFGKFGYIFAFLTLSLFITSPLLSYTITANEISNFTLAIGLVLVFALYRNKFVVKPEFLLLLSAAFYLRVNIIILFIAFCLLHLYQNKNQISKFLMFYTLLFSLIAPGVLIVYNNRLSARISTESNFREEIAQNSINFVSALENSKSFFMFFLALISIIILALRKDSGLFVLLYVCLNFVLYFVINSSELTKEVKYLLEYLYPLSLGIGLLTLITYEKKFIVKICLTLLLLFVNLQGITDTKELKSDFVKAQTSTIQSMQGKDLFLSFKPIPYTQAFDYAKLYNLDDCFNSGVVYGVTPEIMAGYKLKDVHNLIDQRSNFLRVQSQLNEKWSSITPESASRSQIDCVIIGNVDGKKITLETFINAGWMLEAEFIDSDFGTESFILVNK